MTHWIEIVDDLDIDLLGMSDDELDAFAMAHAEPRGSVSAFTPRTKSTERPHEPLPHAA